MRRAPTCSPRSCATARGRPRGGGDRRRALLAPGSRRASRPGSLLRLADVADYGMAGIAPRSVPVRFPPGRGVRAGDGAEVQVALRRRARRARPAARRRRRVGRPPLDAAAGAAGPGRRSRCGSGRCPHRVAARRACRVDAAALVLGVGGDAARPVALDLFAGARPVPRRRAAAVRAQHVLRSLLRQALRAGHPAWRRGAGALALAAEARGCGVPVDRPDDAAARVEAAAAAPRARCWSTTARCSSTARPATRCWLAARRHQRPARGRRRPAVATSWPPATAASARRSGADHCGLLLRPGPVDGELLGVAAAAPPEQRPAGPRRRRRRPATWRPG